MNTRQRCYTAILLVLLMATLCHSQSTNVTLQVTDLDTQTWNNGTWSVQLYSPPGIPCCNYKIAGTTTAVPNQTQAGSLSNTGGATFALTPNGSIAPSGTQWTFNVCPQAFPTQCYTQSFIVTGASQTVIINPPAIRINVNNPVGRVTAYLDTEAINGSLGSSYFNLLDGLIHVCTAVTTLCTYTPLSSGSVANFSSPPPLGNVTPNSVSATSVQVSANGFLMTPDLSCLFHGSDPSLDQFSDVNGVPTWITSGLICQSALLYTPLGPGVNPLDKQVPTWDAASGAFTIQSPTSIGPVFNLRNYGCVADDSTNNATCFANWAAAVNAYSGSGIPEATCDMGPGDIAYKTSGGAAFTIPVSVRGGCVIDYSGTGDVFTLGKSTAVGFTAGQTPLYSVEGITFIGGGSAANGIHALHYASQIRLENNRFRNFGQGNVTLGTCSTWAIKFDSPNNGIDIGRNWWWSDDSTQGRCFLSDVDTSGLGSNSTNVHDNHIYGRLDATTCAGVGVDITGNASKYTNNDTFAVALPIRIRGGLLTSAHNYIDNFNGACSAFGVEAAIEFGAPGAVSAIGNVSFTGDMINTTNVFAKAGDVTSASLNNMYVTSMLFQNASVMTSNLTCTQDCETNDLVNAPTSGVSTFFTTGKQIVHGSTGYFDWTNYDRIIGVGSSKSYKVQTNFAGTPVLREQILDGGEETHTIPTNFGFTLQTPLPATLLRITTGAIWSVFNTTRVNDFALMSSTEHSVPIVETAAALHATPVKVDTGTANHVTVTTTTDTAAGVVVGVLENVAGVSAGATANIVTTGIVPLFLGSGTCAIGQFVIVDTVGNAEVKCTNTYTAGTVIGVALQAQSTINQTLNVLVGLR